MPMRTLRASVPVALAAIAVLAWMAGRWLNWHTLGANQAMLLRSVAAHPALCAVAYVALYAVMVGFSVPLAALMTAAGGLLFGRWAGAALAVAGAGSGAVILFLIIRRLGDASLRPGWAAPSGLRARSLQDHLARDGFSYLLAIRLLPIVPFWVVNIAAALSGMRLAPYALATFIGIVPATFIIVSIGAAAGDIIAAGHRPDFSSLTSPEVLAPLAGLALLALLPTFVRRAHG
jgi:uncharacterized membrane protein YdjX (TVP38/TMEM64 family)